MQIRPSFERSAKRFMRYCNKRTQLDSDFSIAQAALRHTENVLEISQEQLAEESHLSEASISRFFRRCGFRSFWEFKTQMAKFLSVRKLQKTEEYLKEYRGMSEEEIAEELFQHAEKNLAATRQLLDFEKLHQIVERIRDAKTVYFVGDIRDVYCFYSMQMDLMSWGKTAYLYMIDENTAQTQLRLDDKTVVCLLSVHITWYDEEMAEICRRAAEKKSRVICLGQEEPTPEMRVELYYPYGVPESTNDGYYSLPFIAEVLRKLMYQDRLK